MARKKATNNKKKRVNKYQGAGLFRDDAANKAVRNAGLTLGASTLTRGLISPLVQNRRADKAAYNQYMGIMDRAYQNSGYDDFADYCLTGNCPQNPFQGDPPTFRDWRNHDYFGAGETNARPTYRFANDFKEKPLEGTMGPAIKAGARDALISGALTYGANKLLDNTRFGRNLQRNFNVNVGFRRYQPGGAVGNPYSMPTSAATSGYTSTMSGMAGAHQSQMQLAQIQQEVKDEQERRRREAEAADAASKAQLQQEASGLASKEFLGEARDAVKDIRDSRATKFAAQDAALKEASKDYGTNLAAYSAGASSANNIVQGGRMAAEAASPTANVVMNPMYTQGSKQVMTSTVPGMGKEVVVQGTQQVGQEAGKQVATEASKNFGLAASGANPSWANPAAAVAAIGGRAVEHVADDNDDTNITAGEGIGRGLAGAGQGASIGLMFGPVGGLIGAGVGALASLTTQQIQKRRAIKEAEKQRAFDNQIAAAERYAFENSLVKQGQDMGYNIGNSMTNSYLPGYQQGVAYEAGGDPHKRMLRKQNRQTRRAQKQYERASKKANRKGISPYKEGGEMIKRADGSYSPRGLWDNIRANKGSGKKPTKEMLEQEKKIKAEEKKTGGYMKPLPGGAIEFVGPKHSKGGIKLDANTEVEGGETMDKVTMKKGGSQDYIFSDFLKLGGKTFAQRHKEMLKGGATQKQIQNLAKMQEEVARREGRDENGKRDPNMVMQEGGAYNPWAFGTGENWARQARPGENIDMEGFIGGRDYGDIGGTIFSDYYSSGPGGDESQREMFGEDREKWYDEVYVPRVEKYFEDSPDEAYDMLQKMVEGDDPNADNFRRKLLDKDGNMKPKEEALKIAKGLATDKKLGSFHMYLPNIMEEIPPIPGDVPNEIPPKELQPVEPTVPEPEQPGITLRRDVLMPWQLIGPFAELSTKYPQPDKIAAQPTGRIKLPRVNYNAERASLAGSTNAANKFIQNQAAGPGAISSMMATNEKQRAGNLELANAEARANKELAAQEELANLQASQFDSSQGMRASMFNAQAQNLRDQNEYEKRMLAFNQLGTNLAQYGKDLRSYKAEERAAEAFQIDNEYTRQKYLEELRRQSKRKKSEYYGMNDNQLKEAAARMVQGTPTWNAQNQARLAATTTAMDIKKPAEETKRRGGYLSKLGRVKRRRK